MGRQEGGWRVLCDGVWVCWIGEGGGVEWKGVEGDGGRG